MNLGPPTLTEIRLTSFKSFSDEVMRISPVTVLTGRNSNGKSNALDAVGVLARIATGENLSSALDSASRPDGAIRGGSVGCAPHGSDRFSLGCTVLVDLIRYRWEIEIETGDRLHVRSERLIRQANREERTLYYTDDSEGPSIEARVHNGKRGIDPASSFWRDRAVLTQVGTVLKENQAHRSVRRAVDAVRAALAGVYHLDPVPSLMREFVPRKDIQLRRHADNLSASLVALREQQPDDYQLLVALAKQLVDDRVVDIESVTSQLDDVMIALSELQGPLEAHTIERTPAREMSDGLLRVLAVGTALLSDRAGLDIAGAPSPDEVAGAPLLIVEEIENGLHPSQAGQVLELLRTAGGERGKRVIVTTHSPALLDAAEGKLNDSIIVCYRDRVTGTSRLVPLPELAGYARAMAHGSIGDNISRGSLTSPDDSRPDTTEFDKLFGVV